jgi:hypothetical protein
VPASEFFPTTMHIPHLTPAAKQFHCLFNKLSSFVLDLPKIITGYISNRGQNLQEGFYYQRQESYIMKSSCIDYLDYIVEYIRVIITIFMSPYQEDFLVGLDKNIAIVMNVYKMQNVVTKSLQKKIAK